jgi:hypothetical protein
VLLDCILYIYMLLLIEQNGDVSPEKKTRSCVPEELNSVRSYTADMRGAANPVPVGHYTIFTQSETKWQRTFFP